MDLVERIQDAAAGEDFGPEAVQAVLNAALAEGADWLDPRYVDRGGEDWRLHPLYRAPDRSLSVLAAVFRPGVVCPAHDHGSWAVIGIYRGRERETRYRLDGEPARPLVDRVLINPAGTVTVVPEGTIHTVEALDGLDAVSIHVYGTDIVTQRRRAVDLDTGAVSVFQPDFASTVDQ